MRRKFRQILLKAFKDRIIEPSISSSNIDKLSELKRKYRGVIIRISLLWIFFSNVASFFISGVVQTPTTSITYILFKQLLYVFILFIQCIANHYTTIRISTLFSTTIQFIGTFFLVIGFFNSSQEQLLIGQLGFIGYISLCLVILFIIQDFAQNYAQNVGLIRDYWLAIHLGTFIGQILAMQHRKLQSDPIYISKQDDDDEKWSLNLRKTIVILAFCFSTIAILGCYFIFSYFYQKIEHLKLTNSSYVRFINLKQIHLPFNYIRTVLQRKDFIYIILFVSTLTILNSVSQTVIAMQKEVHPEIVIGIKAIAVLSAALLLSIRHQRPNAVINVYQDLIIQKITILSSYITLIIMEFYKMESSILKYILTILCIYLLQMNLAILLCKIFLLQHNIFPDRFSYKFFFYGMFRCLQFLIGLVDALLFTSLKVPLIYATSILLLIQIIITIIYLKKTSFKHINKILVKNQIGIDYITQ